MAAHQQDLPTRTTGSVVDDEDAVPDIDPTNTSGLLEERLQAYKHACRYLEAYISATEKVQKAHAKEYEKVLKVLLNAWSTMLTLIIGRQYRIH